VVESGTGGAVNVPTIPQLLVSGATEVFGGKSHAWFGAYAPIKPEIVVVAFAEMPVVAAKLLLNGAKSMAG